MDTPVPATIAPIQFAVIQTGGTTKHADIVSYVDGENNRVPAILFISQSEEKALRVRKRLLTRANRMKGFADPKFTQLSPVLGVVQVVMEPTVSKPRKPKEPTANGKLTPSPDAPKPAEQHKRADQRTTAKV